MSLLSTAVAIANKVTKSLKMQTTVSWEVAVTDLDGTKTYPNGIVDLSAIVVWQQRNVLTRGGQIVASRATVTILDPTSVISFDDRITLPDGSTGPILSMIGPYDGGGSTHPLMTEVTIG